MENIFFEWDEKKYKSNLIKHGVDFSDLVDVLTDPRVSIVPDTRKEYGEKRYNAYGIASGNHIRFCFTIRKDNIIRVISAFKVHKKEWEKYYGNNQNDS